MEKSIECRHEGHTLRGSLHLPDAAAYQNVPVIILYHSMLNDARGENRVLVHMARFFAEHGIACVRFDFLGFGESDDIEASADIRLLLAQSLTVLEYVQKYSWVESISVAGIGASSMLAAMVANECSPAIARLLLLMPTRLKLPKFRIKTKLAADVLQTAMAILEQEQVYKGKVYVCLAPSDELGNRISEEVFRTYYAEATFTFDHLRDVNHFVQNGEVQGKVFERIARFVIE